MLTRSTSVLRTSPALVLAVLCMSAAAATAQELSGADVWAANCGSCHRMRGVDTYTPAQWNSVVTHMALVARLTPAQTRAVREFLAPEMRTGSLPARRQIASAFSSDVVQPTVSPWWLETEQANLVSGSDVYRSKCAACHGPQGRGDGPAGRRLRTPPRDLTDASQWTISTDAEIAELIRTGRRGMPAVRTLTQAQLDSVVAYVRSLRR
ncbi:MAG TPA: c-type cytochrome [Gemmatimonadaceae bacterium]|nr:c-type cytochrome [Gemmatimonadaceae bacterium]